MNNTTSKALLLTNLGSPDSTSVKDVQRYLNEFLMDERVIDLPYFIRFFIMRIIVIPRRAPESAEGYKKIWSKEGSPLIVLTEKLKNAVAKKANFPVAFAMRYQNPTPKSAIEALLKENPNLEELVVLPLYPHYTMSSFESAVEQIQQLHQQEKYSFKLKFLSPFYDHKDYIKSLAESIKPYLKNEHDKILFSYHGLPEKHLIKDEKKMAAGKEVKYKMPQINYQKQCIETSRLVTELLGIPKEGYEVTFQSRLTAAGTEWIKPYTTLRLQEMPKDGIKKLLVVCPAFINDCLETLEEISLREKENFLNSGGESLELIPCINDQQQFAETIVNWVENGQ